MLHFHVATGASLTIISALALVLLCGLNWLAVSGALGGGSGGASSAERYEIGRHRSLAFRLGLTSTMIFGVAALLASTAGVTNLESMCIVVIAVGPMALGLVFGIAELRTVSDSLEPLTKWRNQKS